MLFRNIKKINDIKLMSLCRFLHNPSALVKERELVWPCFKNVNNFDDKVAIRDDFGRYTYANIFSSAEQLSKEITRKMMGKTNERILFMCPNNVKYVISLWAIWMSGQIAVPLNPVHPQNLLLYYTNDSKPQMIITSDNYKESAQKIAQNTHTQLLVLDPDIKLNCSQSQFETDTFTHQKESFYYANDALILYTSGTTGNPKGVVLTHKNLATQVNMLLEAWKWAPNDAILHTLPLNHVHGIVNALLCPLSIGAKTIMIPKFDANIVWTYLLGIQAKPEDRKVSVFMGVPTMYSKLIEEFDRVFGQDEKMKEHIKNSLRTKMRLMISGSAPLPETVFKRWKDLSGHELLERYGMTEIGMCLSNSYESKREPGYVGNPLPGVTVQLAKKRSGENGFTNLLQGTNRGGEVNVELKNEKETSGVLLVKSDAVFKEYFQRPEATKKEFTEDGYFITGDICQYDTKKKLFKMLGRDNVDIIKSGGHKLSSLEIETELLNNADIKECAVVGLPDEEWGERVAAIVVLNDDKTLTVQDLRSWAGDKLPKYSIPSILKVVQSIPRNSMGKINKKELVKNIFSTVK